MTNRITGFPVEPTFVFSSIYRNDGRLGVLRDCGVEAVMESFVYIKSEPPKRIFKFLNWPARRYMDSGMFTIMRKSGTYGLKRGGHIDPNADYKPAVQELLEGYLSYLEKYGRHWDHLVELDTDNIAGLGHSYALEARERLVEVVGYEKTLPVWHGVAEAHYSKYLGAWRRMIRDFPYVAIGGDPPRDFRLFRHMTNMAHAQGVLVHGLGTTSPEDFKAAGWDSGDSTNWVAGARYGRFIDMQASKKMDSVAISRLRSAGDYLASINVTKEQLLAPGKSYAKLYLSVQRELKRQEEVRRWAKERKDASARIST